MKVWRVPYPKFGDGPGLKRVCIVAERLGVTPQDFGQKGAVIVGSNGKGSTAAMCAAILQRAGKPVGLFTSPHLLRLNERFRVNGVDIDDATLEHHWMRVMKAVDAAGLSARMGGFEFLFLIGADWFRSMGCVHTIWEAGIGGRLDPVRQIEARRLALTALDLEHTELLGDTLEDIARDKADAAPEGATIYTVSFGAATDAAIDAHCAQRGVAVVRIGADDQFVAPLPGAHQALNAALAIQLARDVVALDSAGIRLGLAATRWPGRLELIERAPDVFIDVGHTPRGVEAALAGFEALRGDRPGVLVCGVSRDKDVTGIVAALAPTFPLIVCVAAAHKGAPAPLVAAQAVRGRPAGEIFVAGSVTEARKLARSRARAMDGAVYVAGSLFLAAEFKAAALGLDPDRICFF